LRNSEIFLCDAQICIIFISGSVSHLAPPNNGNISEDIDMKKNLAALGITFLAFTSVSSFATDSTIAAWQFLAQFSSLNAPGECQISIPELADPNSNYDPSQNYHLRLVDAQGKSDSVLVAADAQFAVSIGTSLSGNQYFTTKSLDGQGSIETQVVGQANVISYVIVGGVSCGRAIFP
jgi:hypothetical protein